MNQHSSFSTNNQLIPDIWRKTEQHLAPLHKPGSPDNNYDLYPAFPAEGAVFSGFDSLAEWIASHQVVAMDGYNGVFFDLFKSELEKRMQQKGKTVCWWDTCKMMKSKEEINQLIRPFMGGDDPLFGTRCSLNLIDYFDPEKLAQYTTPTSDNRLHLIIGCGATLVDPSAALMYIDLPKNELQFRLRAESTTNLGASTTSSQKEMYKRSYFVDWVLLNRHKQSLLPSIALIVDGQRPLEPVMMNGNDFRKTLQVMSRNFFRVRPWFEPGAWGGNWIKQHIPSLAQNVPNYAWSFELIVPENGLMMAGNEQLLEVSFDFLMFQESKAVLGEAESRFGAEFPIRFDFLDTIEGGNLSVQCHPQTDYIRKHFGENFTQDETYYILDAKEDAKVYLGFQPTIDPPSFKKVLEESAEKATPVAIEEFVQAHPASRHDLFLIPGGTVHGAGKNNMVLEISSTPYIFTFKMYDWLRLDLDGKPRTLNLDRAFENLDFNRKGELIEQEFISRPVQIGRGSDWELIHLPTHPNHFYDVHRFDFTTAVEAETNQSCHILMLVEGEQVRLETADGMVQTFHYAETFVVPAACTNYRLVNLSGTKAKVIKAFVKPEATQPSAQI